MKELGIGILLFVLFAGVALFMTNKTSAPIVTRSTNVGTSISGSQVDVSTGAVTATQP